MQRQDRNRSSVARLIVTDIGLLLLYAEGSTLFYMNMAASFYAWKLGNERSLMFPLGLMLYLFRYEPRQSYSSSKVPQGRINYRAKLFHSFHNQSYLDRWRFVNTSSLVYL